jgi:hypothetical protein
MIDYESLPSSEAKELNHSSVVGNELKYTFTEKIDEEKLYSDITMKLSFLEKSDTKDKGKLELVASLAGGFQTAFIKKEEILLRIEWLNRLYKVQEEINSAGTKDQVKELKKYLSVVQTCPLKKQLVEKLNNIELSLFQEETAPVSFNNLLMTKSIESAGASFLNLGKMGREFVINDVIRGFGLNASVEKVAECAEALEESVKRLLEIQDTAKLINQLEKLPLPAFTSLKAASKKAVVTYLIKNAKWNGLLDLDNAISEINNDINKEEIEKENAKNIIMTSGGEAAATMNYDNLTKSFRE